MAKKTGNQLQHNNKRYKLNNNFTVKIQGFHAISALLSAWVEHIAYLGINTDNPRGRRLAEIAQQQNCPYTHETTTHAVITPLPEQTDDALEAALCSGKWQRLLLLDGITDTRNLGAIIRCACAFGIDAVIIPRNHAAATTTATYQTSAGALLFTPLVRVNNLNKAIIMIRNVAIATIGTVCDKHSTPLADVPAHQQFALILGAEDKGMKSATKKLCDYMVSIPMHNNMDSLNVSVAAGVLLYHLTNDKHNAAVHCK